MKIAMIDGYVILIEVKPSMSDQIIAAGMEYDRIRRRYVAPISAALLDNLSKIMSLPAPVEEERQKRNRTLDAINRERNTEDPVPLVQYPVKINMYKHQIRGANMALLALGIIGEV